MRISQIIQETTTSGSVATVTQPLLKGAVTRDPSIYGKQGKPGTMFKGKVTNNPFVNSISESAIKEEEISEQDLIVVPGQGRLKRTGFVKHDLDRGESEGETLKNSLHTIIRVATHLDKALSVQDSFPEWVSEKVGAVKSMMVSVMDYLISSQEMQHDSDAMEDGVSKFGLYGAAAAAALAPEAGLTGMKAGYKAGSAVQRAFTKESDLHPEHLAQLRKQAEISRKTGLKVGDLVTIPKYPGFEGKIVHDWGGGDFTISGGGGGVDQGNNHRANARIIKKIEGVAEGNNNWGGPLYDPDLQKGKKKPKLSDVKVKIPSNSPQPIKKKPEQDVAEDAKVDRMVGHVKSSEKRAGHSDKEAENIAWATANKRGMLNNRNKK